MDEDLRRSEFSERILIISPTAGFGNRVRALCGAIALANLSNRKIQHCWEIDASWLPHEAPPVVHAKMNGLAAYFQVGNCPVASQGIPVDICYSEWIPGEPWYQEQSYGQKKNPPRVLSKYSESESILSSPETVVMIETSLIKKPINLSEEQWCQSLREIYRSFFTPCRRFVDMLTDTHYDVGISIRRNEFTRYFPEANQSLSDLTSWVNREHSGKKVIIFSDDYLFRDSLRSSTKQLARINDEILKPWERGFLEFLTLAYRCEVIYGTPSSSFAYEAALFGGKPYHHTLFMSPRVTTPKVDSVVGTRIYSGVYPKVLVALLLKDSENYLPLYLKCLEAQDYPKDRICIYIRTNNNKDQTVQILDEWIPKAEFLYASVHYDKSDVDHKLENYDRHEWNTARFDVLGKIRQDSLLYTLTSGCDYYFTADGDNFIKPNTLISMVQLQLPIVSPFLVRVVPPGARNTLYSNYHYRADANGYYQDDEMYHRMYQRKVIGIIEADVVHCTYCVRADVVPELTYVDGSSRHEYVIFSDSARRAKIPQYLDNREVYGYLTFEEKIDDIPELAEMKRNLIIKS